jgi:hypothetical protein
VYFDFVKYIVVTTLSDKVCHWLATSRWFSPGTPVSSTSNKTDRLDITIHHSSSHSPIRCGSRHLPKGGGAVFFRKTKSDFKTICFKINQKIPRRNSKLKLQNMVKREITRTSLKIFWFLFVCLFVCLFFLFLRVYILAQKGDSGPGPPLNPPIFVNSVYHNVLSIYYWYLQYSRNAMCVLN